jgi:DNA polymerase elongation subunit (family B)
MAKPKIVVWDLETGNLNANLSAIICFGWRVLGEKGTAKVKSTWDFKKWDATTFKQYNDKELCKFIYDILSDADGIITHFGSGFDLKFLNSRLRVHGMPPLPPIKHIDTCMISWKRLKLASSRLDSVAAFFGLDQKTDIVRVGKERGLPLKHKWDLWTLVSLGNKKAMALMAEYCAQDVDVLEKVYHHLLPLVSDHPNWNLFTDKDVIVCPHCGSTHVQKRGTHVGKTATYQRYQCQECGSWFRVDKKGKNARGF